MASDLADRLAEEHLWIDLVLPRQPVAVEGDPGRVLPRPLGEITAPGYRSGIKKLASSQAPLFQSFGSSIRIVDGGTPARCAIIDVMILDSK